MTNKSMEDMPFCKFHMKIFSYASGSSFVDGYSLGIIAIALSVMQNDFEMSVTMIGLLGMGTLAGMVIGGLVGGYFTDILGRKKMFIIDMLLLGVFTTAQFFVADPMQLVVLRLLIGIALGTDYPIAGSLMSEFAPRKHRGALLGGINAFWFIGYAISYLVGYFMLPLGTESWRWMLLSGALPIIFLLLARLNMPESPHWLTKQGKNVEAAQIVKKIFGDDVVVSNTIHEHKKTNLADIFKNGYGRRTFFVSVFWSLQVMTTFAIGTYIPEILSQFGFHEGSQKYLGSAVINMFYLIGIFPALYLVEKYGRRPTLIWPFLITALALLSLGIVSGGNAPFLIILVLFIIYGIFNTAMGSHQWIYPYELFPTYVRGTGGGFTTTVSRLASALSTFFFPMILENYGLSITMYISSTLLFIGFILSIYMAPETKGKNLEEAGAI
ncbi:MFS transporter [Staphylococcus cohnii]|uniref:MFS transporter n=1 Tax=Staphylococcus cohnii TaxID=29382 RepID=UPI003D7D9DAA